MPSDFAKVGKQLEADLSVPALPIDAIRGRSRVQRRRHQWRLVVLCAFAAIAALGSGTVLAAKVFGFQAWLSQDRVAATRVRSFIMYQGPDQATLRHVVSSATFPVVLPVGLPAGERVLRLVVAPADHPSIIMIQYLENGYRQYTLIDSSLVQNGSSPQIPGIASAPISAAHYWRAGGEVVFSENPSQWPQDPAVRAAMLRATPAESLAKTASRLYRITSAGAFGLGLENMADALAPSSGRSALVGPQNLGQVAALVRAHKAIFAVQSTKFDHIPVVQGHEDLAHASLHPGPQELAVSVDGVRAISAVLSTNACGSGPKFTCEILINERSGMPYRIWVLATRPPKTAQAYVVDAKSFQVERAQ